MNTGGLAVICALLLVGCLTLGGATRPGFFGDVILQILAIPVLLAGLQSAQKRWADRHVRAAVIFAGALLLLPILQLVPLPPALWTAFPGQQSVTRVYEAVGTTLPWRPVSVSSRLTWLSLLSLLPPLAVFFGVLAATHRERRLLSLVVIAMATLSAFLGLMQVAQGPDSPLYMYAETNRTEAVGFFANRNHFAALMYCAILLVGAWSATLPAQFSVAGSGQANGQLLLKSALAATILLVFICAAAMARSRAGLLLAMAALVAVLALSAGRSTTDRPARRLAIAAVVISVVLIAEFALYRIMDRFASDPMGDVRFGLSKTTIDAAWQFFPVGSGLGTFVPVYAMYEAPADLMLDRYVNHAHNDWAQALLEGGLGAILLVFVVGIWLFLRSRAIWRAPPSEGHHVDVPLARAGSVIIVLLALHSIVDYPIRTAGMMAMAAFAAALLINPLPERRINKEAIATGAGGDPDPYLQPPVDGEAPAWAQQPWPKDTAAGQGTTAEEWPRPAAAQQSSADRDTPGSAPWNDSRSWPEEWRREGERDPAKPASEIPQKSGKWTDEK